MNYMFALASSHPHTILVLPPPKLQDDCLHNLQPVLPPHPGDGPHGGPRALLAPVASAQLLPFPTRLPLLHGL